MWSDLIPAIDAAIQERVQDILCFLFILAIVALSFWNCVDVMADYPARDYAGVTEWAQAAKEANR